MSDTTQEQAPPVETPEVPDFETQAAEEAIAEAEKAPKPTRRRKRKESPEVTARRQAAYKRGERSKDMEYDEWIETWDWHEPRMQCTVKRTSPPTWLGKPSSGRCGSKANAFYTEEEIQSMFGGGTYIVYVSGIDPNTGKYRALGNKLLNFPGDPKPLPEHADGTPPGAAPRQQGGTGVEDLAPQAQAGLVGLLGEQMKHNREAGPATTADPEVLAQMQRAYEQQAQAVAHAADARVADFQRQLDDLRVENERLRAENHGFQAKIDSEVGSARAEGERFVGQMLPTFASQADQRVQQILHDTGEKVRAIQEQYARDLQNAQQHYQQQLQNQQTLFQAAEQNAQTLFQGQINHMQNANALLQAKVDALEGECRGLRDQVLNMHREAATKQDPMQRLQEMQTLQEVVQGMAGSMGGGGDDLGEDASPALKLAARFAPAIAGAIDVAKAKFGIDAGQPQMVPPQQMMGPPPGMMPPPQLMQQLPSPQPPQMTPQPIPPGAMMKPQQAKARPQRRVRRPDAKVRKQDLVAGVTMLNAAIASGADPQAAANTAASQIDRNTLNALCSRKPEVVIQSLQSAGILQGAVASEPGQQYLIAFLQALQVRLNPPPAQPPPASVAPQGREPTPAPAPEEPPKTEEPPDGEA
jgi:hypothetical protein